MLKLIIEKGSDYKMNCKNCENKIKDNNWVKKTFICSVISLMLFFIVLLLLIFCMIEFYKDDSGAGGWIIILFMFQIGLPLIALVGLSRISSNSIKKHIQEGLNVPKNLKKINTINKFQIPLFIFIFVIGFILKGYKHEYFINSKLNELYNSNYEIVNSCKRSNEGGINYKLLVLKLENFEYPIISRFDWAHDNYEDNYDELIRADKLDYHSYINSIFGSNVISLMYFDNEEKYNYKYRKQINLNILLSSEYLNNQNALKLKTKKIISKYTSQFPNYDFFFNIYFTNRIDDNLLQEYYIYMSEKDDCARDFELQVSSFIMNGIHIRIDENTNIDTEVNDSFYNKY